MMAKKHEYQFERRRYGRSAFYTWAYVKRGDQWISLGDPWPGVHWPKKALAAAASSALELGGAVLIFGKANAKLRELEKLTGLRIGTFSIPAGRTCPGALTCKAWVRADPVTGQRRLIDGPSAETRCFAANDEATYPQTFRARRHNLDLLRKAKTADRIADLIVASIPRKYDAIRWHVFGRLLFPRLHARNVSRVRTYARTPCLVLH